MLGRWVVVVALLAGRTAGQQRRPPFRQRRGGRKTPKQAVNKAKALPPARLDTEAAARGTNGLEEASHSELVQRVAALGKQNELLRQAEVLARKELARQGAKATWTPVPRSAIWNETVEGKDDEKLREMVRELVAENEARQRVEMASGAAVRALDAGAVESLPEGDLQKFVDPPKAWECAVIQVAESSLEGAFEATRFDGRKQPRSPSSKWKAWWCPTVAVWLSKSAHLCEEDRGQTVSQDAEVRGFASARGPDELYGSLHGREATALRWTRTAKCTYAGFFFQLEPGEYHLQLAHFREGFAGFAETRPLWPPMHFDFPLGRSGVFVKVRAAGGTRNEDAVPPSKKSDQAPFCDQVADGTTRILDGRFVYAGDDDPFFGGFRPDPSEWSDGVVVVEPPNKRDVPLKDIRPFKDFQSRTLTWPQTPTIPGKVHWTDAAWWVFAVDPARYEWRPRTCKLRFFSQSDRAWCLSRKRLVMSGDSNMNALMKGLLGTACAGFNPRKLATLKTCAENVGPAKRQCASSELLLARKAGTCQNLWVGMQIQHYGDVMPPSGLALDPNSPAALVANFGQWPAAKAHFSLARYKSTVDAWFRSDPTPKKSNKVDWGPNTTRIWASTIPLVRNDAWVRATQDWRTLSRLQLFNEYADKIAAQNNWLVFDEWNLTLPFLLAPREDIAHAAESQRHHHTHVFFNLLCNDHAP